MVDGGVAVVTGSAEPGKLSDTRVIEESLVEPGLFGLLYDRHEASLYRYAYRRAGPGIAEDLVAETFLVAFARRRHFDPVCGDARAWLFGILTKEISHHHRREKTRLRAVARSCQTEVANDSADQALVSADARAARGLLAAALAKLSRGDRDVLLLIAWSGLSYTEAAQALDIAVGTVRSRLNRARRKVRAALGGDDPTRVIEESP
ncbi:MAG: RNA polymerase sigma factor [Micromonosporaceae bacterium]|nr:RNA polymerase sigma factor [Micromonosporaceae bacterium]